MTKTSFKRKIILPVILILVVLTMVLTAYLYSKFSVFSHSLIQNKLDANINSLNLHLDTSAAHTRTAAVSVAESEETARLIKERELDRLSEMLFSAQDLFQISYFVVTDERGSVLARTHETHIGFDYVMNQHNITDAMKGVTSTYFESGNIVRVAVRTGAPVYDVDGSLLGVVSACVRFDSDEEIDTLKKLLNSEIGIYYDDVRINTTVYENGRRQIGTPLSPSAAETLGGGREYTGNLIINGKEYITYYKPLFNSDNEVFASIFMGMTYEDLEKESAGFIRGGITIGLVSLAISISILYVVMSSISKPIITLSKDMEKIATGNLTVETDTFGNDEVGLLGKSLKKAVETLNRLLTEIVTMIDEQKKGNSDYIMNTEPFRGDFKTLAEIILELSAFGNKDKLTGIPNRRSFDNRMELEWERASRDGKPISILIIDVDKFKLYNDSFGHQQGDVALQHQAALLGESIRRKVDFYARWGGEEFVVLLPSTDQNGALMIAEIIRKTTEDSTVPPGDEKSAKITVSIGVNTVVPGMQSTISEFISLADIALYKAKSTGRNRVCSSD